MKTIKSFVEEELERESQLQWNPELRIQNLFERVKSLFTPNQRSVGKAINDAFTKQKTGISTFEDDELTGEAARSFLSDYYGRVIKFSIQNNMEKEDFYMIREET